MSKIRVKDYVETAFSMEDAKIISEVIGQNIKSNMVEDDSVELDFQGIRYFTTLFFNNAVVNYIGVLGAERYSKIMLLSNLSDVGKSTYQHSLDNAREFYAMTDGQKQEFEDTLKATLSDVLED